MEQSPHEEAPRQASQGAQSSNNPTPPTVTATSIEQSLFLAARALQDIAETLAGLDHNVAMMKGYFERWERRS